MKDLLQRKNVQGYGKGHKYVNGVDTGRETIVVFVSKKVPLNRLDAEDVVPEKYKGVETDVIEVGEIKPLRTTEHRPAPGGVSIGHYKVTAGTLGMVIEDANGFRFILSNNHVLADSNNAQFGDPIYQPGVADGGIDKNIIGYLVRFVPIKMLGEGQEHSNCPVAKIVAGTFNLLAEIFGRKTRLNSHVPNINLTDCALASSINDEDLSDEILDIGKPIGYADVGIGAIVKKSGRTSGLTFGKVLAVEATINVNFGNGVAEFRDQIVTEKMGSPGDSGSVVLNECNEIIGLLFAGSDIITAMNKIQNVRKALELL